MIDNILKDIIEQLEYALREEDWDAVEECLVIIKEDLVPELSSDDLVGDEEF